MGPWRDLILKHFPLLQGRMANDDGWLSLNCPLHNDSKQSAGLNVESGRFVCHSPKCQDEYLTSVGRNSTGAKSLSLSELLHFVYGWSVADASTVVEDYRVDRLDSDFAHDDDTHNTGNIVHFFSHEVEEFVRAANQRLADHFDSIDIAIDYAATRGLLRETLVRTGVGYVSGRTELPDGTTSGVHGCLLLPYWFRSRLVGVRIRQADSRKRMLRASHYVPYNLNSVFNTTSRTVVVAEGESDTLRLEQSLHDAGLTNIPVVGTPGVSFDIRWSRFLRRFNRVIAIPQADMASQKEFVRHLRQAFDDRLEVVSIPWEEDALGGKDVCDYLLMQPQSERDFVELLGLSGQDTEERPYLKTYDYFQNRQDRPIDWLIPNVVERGSKVLIVGDPKVGKTFIALDLIESCIRGKPLMNNPDWTPRESGMRCLLIEEEGSERALTQRILSIVTPTDRFGVIHGEGVKLDDPTSFARLRQEVMRFKPDLIVFDPYASLHNQDENTVDGTMRVMGAINVIYRALPGCTVVVLHHRSKLGGGARGSGALWGAVDYQIVLKRPENSKGVVGVSVEGREIDETEPVYFEFDPSTLTFSPQTTPTYNVVKKSSIDTFLADEVERHLKESEKPMTTNDVCAKLDNPDYMAVRGVLLDFFARDLVVRTGNGGRSGYQYAWKIDP